MKRFLVYILSSVIVLAGCGSSPNKENQTKNAQDNKVVEPAVIVPVFDGA